jgi:pilus assembly protein CpaB
MKVGKVVLPIVLAVVAGFFAFAALAPQPQATIVVAAADLPAGHTLTAEDLTTATRPAEATVATAFTDTTTLIGQTLSVPRTAGDALLPTHFGQTVALRPDERALAVQVNDATGLAGLLKPGQHVGVAAVFVDRNDANAQAKVALGGLRVLYLPPVFRAASEPKSETDADSGSSSFAATPQRRDQGVVVLAVSITPQTITYNPPSDLKNTDGTTPAAVTKIVNPVEFLTMLNAAPDAVLTLYLEPEQPASFTTTGLSLNEIFTFPTFVTDTVVLGEGGNGR